MREMQATKRPLLYGPWYFAPKIQLEKSATKHSYSHDFVNTTVESIHTRKRQLVTQVWYMSVSSEK